MSTRALAALITASLPNLASATVFTFASDCAPPLTVDLGDATLVQGFLYSIPPVPWNGTQITVIQASAEGLSLASDITGSHGVSVAIDSDLFVTGGTPAMLTLDDIGEFPVLGGPGVVITPSGFCSLTEVTHIDPLDDLVGPMQLVANGSFGSAPVQDDAGPARLRTATFRDQLASARQRLLGAGCSVDVDDWIAGAFRPGTDATTGEDADGAELLGTLDLRRRRFSGALDGASVGERFSRYDATHRFVIDDGDDIRVGYGARVQGRSGVFMGFRASCPVPASAEAALDGWVDGPLDGLDFVDPGFLEGVWSVDAVCGGAVTQTWTITDGGSDYTISGADFSVATIDRATYTIGSTYAIEGPPVAIGGAPPGTDTRPLGTLVFDGPDAFSGSFDIIDSFFCTLEGTRL